MGQLGFETLVGPYPNGADIVMLILALGSVAIYADVAFGPPREKPAFVFLVVPLASWLLIGNCPDGRKSIGQAVASRWRF